MTELSWTRDWLGYRLGSRWDGQPLTYNLRWLLRAIAKLGIGPVFLCLLQMALLPATVLRSAQTGGGRAQFIG